MAQPPSDLTVGEMMSNVRKSASKAAEKEQQMFSPSTKQVIEEIACTVAMDERTVLPSSAAKRGIVFHDGSAENEAVLSTEKSPSPSHDIPVPNIGPQSPVKKLKNKLFQMGTVRFWWMEPDFMDGFDRILDGLLLASRWKSSVFGEWNPIFWMLGFPRSITRA